MAQQIQDLVASIRRDGVEVAQQEAKAIVEKAKSEAAEIVARAEKEAKARLDEAQREIERKTRSARSSLAQASRDAQISLDAALRAQLQRLLVEKVKKAYTSKDLISLITKVVELAGSPEDHILEVSAKEFKALSADLTATLADEMKKGLEIKPVATVDAGFSLVQKDGAAFFDFSASESAVLLKPFLSPAIDALIFNEE
jgi:V/A-type H+-transporting ATPase subunit E